MNRNKRCILFLVVGMFTVFPCTAAPEPGNLTILKNSGVYDLKLVFPSGLARDVQALDALALAPNTMLVGKTVDWPRVATKVGTLRTFELPFILQKRTSSGTVDLKVILVVDNDGLHFSARSQAFLGSVEIGVIDASSPNRQVDLEQDISFLISSNAAINPPRIDGIRRTFTMHRVSLEAASTVDAVVVHIRPSFDQDSLIDVPVNVVRQPLAIEPALERINGFGLQATNVRVLAPGNDNPQLVKVILKTDAGILAPDTVSIGADGFGIAELRSSGTGIANIRAIATGMSPAATSVRFIFPWLFLGSVLLGGLAGSIIRIVTARENLPLGRLLLGLVVGILSGLVAAAAETIGVNLTGISLPTSFSLGAEVGTFTVAAIVGFLGKLVIRT